MTCPLTFTRRCDSYSIPPALYYVHILISAGDDLSCSIPYSIVISFSTEYSARINSRQKKNHAVSETGGGIPKDQIMVVDRAPMMTMVIEAMSTLGNKDILSLRAREDNIPRAVVVANILTEKMMRQNSRVYKILLDGKMRPDGSMASTIEIIMTKV